MIFYRYSIYVLALGKQQRTDFMFILKISFKSEFFMPVNLGRVCYIILIAKCRTYGLGNRVFNQNNVHNTYLEFQSICHGSFGPN